MPRPVRTHTVLQMELVECGAAALATILRHFGRIVPLEEMRVACDVSRDGTNAANLVTAARNYGLKAKGLRKTPDTLRALKMPVIAHWNFSHFLVVEGFRNGLVHLSDPSQGRYRVSDEEFARGFTGVVLAFEPGPDFRKADTRRGIFATLLDRLRGELPAFVRIVAASLALLIPGLAVPFLTQVFIDEVLVQNLHDRLMPLLSLLALMIILNAGFGWFRARLQLRLTNKLAVSASANFLRHVLHLPIEFFAQRFGGDVAARVAINDRVASILTGDFAVALLSLITAVFYVGMMLFYDPLLTAISVTAVLLNLVALHLIADLRSDGNRKQIQEEGRLAGSTASGLRSIETLKATGGESDFYERWSGLMARTLNARREFGSRDQRFAMLPAMLQTASTAAILCIGGLRVIDGHLTIGMLVAFQALAAAFAGPVAVLTGLASTLQEVGGQLERLDDVLRYEQAPGLDRRDESPESQHRDARLRGEVVLQGISFGYRRLAAPLLHDFSLHLAPGSRVALVGGSGSGKSTVARLVCGLYQPWSGEILYDGRRRGEISRSLLARSLALVDQDILLFRDSIRANLTLWDETIPFPQIERAARDAMIDDVILQRSGGYDSTLLEGGTNLSGGQRQRLEIARALAVDPTIIVLDEATSALDPLVEKAVMDNIRHRGCTCLVVAHRLTTIRDCDEILVMKAGSIVERGTHDELVARRGEYLRLIEAEE